MRRLQKQENIKLTKNTPKFIKVILIIFVAVFVLEIWMANRLTTDGNKINHIKTAEARLELENQALENQIAQSSSLASIEKSSLQLGFNSIKDVEYYKPASIASAL